MGFYSFTVSFFVLFLILLDLLIKKIYNNVFLITIFQINLTNQLLNLNEKIQFSSGKSRRHFKNKNYKQRIIEIFKSTDDSPSNTGIQKIDM